MRTRKNNQRIDWALLCAQVKRDDPQGAEDLYRYCDTTIRYYVAKQFPNSDVIDDHVHDIYLQAWLSIKRADIRIPEHTRTFVVRIAQRHVYEIIANLCRMRKDYEASSERRNFLEGDPAAISVTIKDDKPLPEHEMLSNERWEFVKLGLKKLNAKQREIIMRFYLIDQPASRIQAEMNLGDAQFRCFKSRTKAELAQIVQDLMQRKGFSFGNEATRAA